LLIANKYFYNECKNHLLKYPPNVQYLTAKIGIEPFGNHTLYHHSISTKPMHLYFVNDKSYISLNKNNFSSSDKNITTYEKIRVNPVSLIVKTDDYTFAESSFETMSYNYWNGKQLRVMDHIPYATAISVRFVCSKLSVDLADTNFELASDFALMGFYPKLRHMSPTVQTLQASVIGNIGRFCSSTDISRYENGKFPDANDEGLNGGWVLELKYYKH